MGRFGRGVRLAGASFSVLRSDPEIMVLPLAGTLAWIAVFFGSFFLFAHRLPSAADVRFPHYLAVFPLIWLASIPATFANAAVVAAARIRLEGGDPTIADGLRAAWAKAPRLVAWSLVTGVFALLMNLIAERLKIGGLIARWTIGIAWALATLFVVPVLLFEDLGVVASIKRSATLFMERWGESVVATAAVSGIVALAFIPVVIVGVILTASDPRLGIAFFVIAFGVLIAVSGALNGVYTTALYQFASTGETPGAFGDVDMNDAYTPKKRRFGLS